jgi:hypothetical protein
MRDDHLRGHAVEAIEEGVKAAVGMLSASVVEPRMSAKSIVSSISAPPWWRDSKVKHVMHQFGFMSDGRLPMTRMIGAPIPANGAAQIRQRGSVGMSLKRRRLARSRGSPWVRNSRQNAASVASGFLSEVTAPLLCRRKRSAPDRSYCVRAWI